MVYTDLNDGLLQEAKDELGQEDTAVGEHCNSHQGLAGDLFHETLKQQQMMAVTTIQDIGASYIGPTGHESNIDHIGYPQGKKEDIKKIEADKVLGKKCR